MTFADAVKKAQANPPGPMMRGAPFAKILER